MFENMLGGLGRFGGGGGLPFGMPSGFGNPFGFQSGPRLVEGGPSFYMPPSFGMQFPSAMGPMGFGGMGGMGGFQPGMMPLMSQFGQFARPMPRPQPQPSFDPQMLQGIFQNLFEQFNRAPEGEQPPQPAEQPDYLSQIQDLQRQLEELRSGQQEQDLGTPEITTGTDELMDRMFPDGPPPFQPDVGGGGQVSTMPIAPPGGFPRFGEEVGEGLTIGETIDMGGGSYTDPGGDPSGLIAERPPIKVGPVRPPLFEREIIPPILKGGPVDPGVIDQMVIVYGPDGTMYPSPGAARAAGVTDYTMTPPGGGFRLPGFGDISGPPSELLPPGAGGTGNIPEIGIGRGPGGPGEIVPPMVPPLFEREIIPPEGGGFRGLPPGLGRDLRIPRPMPGSLIGGPSRDRFGMPIDQGPIRIPPQRGPEDPIMRTMPVMPPGGFPRFGVEPIMRPMPMPRPGILPEIPRPDVGGGGRVSTMPVRLPMPRFPR